METIEILKNTAGFLGVGCLIWWVLFRILARQRKGILKDFDDLQEKIFPKPEVKPMEYAKPDENLLPKISIEIRK